METEEEYNAREIKRFKHLSNKALINLINKLFANDDNDDDQVRELFRRRDIQNFKVKVGFDTYEIEEAV